jgi:hypothetical protein
MTQDEIIEMAIQGHAGTRDAIRWAINQALAEHAMRETQRLGQEIEQEPVFTYEQVKAHIQVAMMSTTPPQRKPLTDEQMKKSWYAMQNIMGWYSFQEIARAIEAAHGIKENT